ncbi:MAG: ATP-binding protein [Rhodocyclaceae bacterium]|nr:MAG: ATP-binding protein [Rhodocyclaceae bacterium]
MIVEEELRRYLRVLYQHVIASDGAIDDDYEVEVRSLRPAPTRRDPGAKRPLHGYLAGVTVDDVVARVTADAARAGVDVFVGVHLRRRECATGGDESVGAVVAVIADIDCAKHGIEPERALAVTMRHPAGPPTMVVSSGGGLHAYWIYDEAAPVDREGFGQGTARTHRRCCAFTRYWINRELTVEVHGEAPTTGRRRVDVGYADDMSSLDRILRPAGTFNRKRERAVAGQAPLVSIVYSDSRVYSMADFEDAIEPGFDADRAAKPQQRPSATPLATTLSRRVVDALERLGAGYKIRKQGQTGYIAAISLDPCPACGRSNDCYLSPRSGRLTSWHNSSCPAASGMPLDEWLRRYVVPHERVDDPRPRQRVVGLDVEAKTSRLDEALAVFVGDEGAYPLGRFASTAAMMGEVVWVSPQATAAGEVEATLVAAAGAGDYLLPLRDGGDRVRNGMWISTSRLLPETVALGIGDEIEGGFLAAGRPGLAAVAAITGKRRDDEPDLFITLTAADYLATVGLCAERNLVAPVIGLVYRPERALAELRRVWTRKRPRRVDVIAAGSDAVVKRGLVDAVVSGLIGYAGVVVHDFGGGLVAAAETLGVVALEARIRSQVWRVEPPIAIGDASDQLDGLIRGAVDDVVAAGRDGPVILLTPPPGVGKSTVAQAVAAERARAGETVAFATPGRALALEKYDAHLRRHADVPAKLALGALQYCHYADVDEVEEMFAFVGRSGLCGHPGSRQRCPHADADPPCPGAMNEAAPPGTVVYLAEPKVPESGPWDLVIVDEGTHPLVTIDASRQAITTVFNWSGSRRTATWQNMNKPAVDAAFHFVQWADTIARDHCQAVADKTVPAYDRYIEPADLSRLFDRDLALWGDVDIGFEPEAAKPPKPLPSHLRSGLSPSIPVPHPAAWRVFVELRRQHRRLRQMDPAVDVTGPRPPAPHVELVLDPKVPDRWCLRCYMPKSVSSAPTVILDATGDLARDRLRRIIPHRPVIVRGMPVFGEPPAVAYRILTQDASRSKMSAPRKSREGQGKRVTGAGDALLRRCLKQLAAEAARRTYRVAGERLQLGLITFKDLAEWLQREGAGAALIAEVEAEYDASISLGWYGRDSRGTNRFERCHGFALIGEPTPNLGATSAICRVLDLDPETEQRALIAEELLQAIHRTRFTRRSAETAPVLMMVTAKAAIDVPGVEWTPARITGAPAMVDVAGDAYAWLLAEHGVTGPWAIVRERSWQGFYGDPDQLVTRLRGDLRPTKTAYEAWSRYRATLAGMFEFKVKRGDGVGPFHDLVATSVHAAARWAMVVAGTTRAYSPRIAGSGSVFDFIADPASKPPFVASDDINFLYEIGYLRP